MKELKFRAWVNEHWIYWVPNSKTLGEYNEVGTYADEYNTENNCYIEQYTGAKDQYNTPIYEGDIIRICETDIGEVIQDYDGRWIILGIPKDKLRDSILLRDLEKLQKWCLVDILSKEYCTVIGNIHENQELIGGK